MAEEGERIGKLRQKLKEIVDNIDNAEMAKVECHHLHVEAAGHYEKLEIDRLSEVRRKQLLIFDAEDRNDRLEIAQEKLKKSVKAHGDEEEALEVLEAKEAATEQRIEKMESKIKNLKRTLELNQARVVDGERKVKVCRNDITKLQEKADAYEARAAVLDATITAHGKNLDELEEREGTAGEKEALNEEKIHFLIGQVKELEIRADAAERANAVSNNLMLETNNEIALWSKKTQDMEEVMMKMDDLADDPAYDVLKRYQNKSAVAPPTMAALSARGSIASQGRKEEKDEEVSSRASSRAGRQMVRPPKSPEPESEPKEEHEPEQSDESEEESESEESEEE